MSSSSVLPVGEALPVAAFDHVVVSARDRLAAAAEVYRRLGFHLTPIGRHTLGSINHLAVFATDYLELVGTDPEAATVRGELLRFPAGLNGVVFATEDATAAHRALAAAGLRLEPPLDFARPVTLPEGAAEARFRVLRLKPEEVDYGRVYFCQHRTRDLVWRDEWRRHPNGVVALARVLLCADAPEAAAALYRRLFGAEALRAVPGGFSLAVGLARLDILSPAAAAAEWGAALPAAAGRTSFLAGMSFRTTSLATAGRALEAGGVGVVGASAERLLAAAASGFDTAVEFTL